MTSVDVAQVAVKAAHVDGVKAGTREGVPIGLTCGLLMAGVIGFCVVHHVRTNASNEQESQRRIIRAQDSMLLESKEREAVFKNKNSIAGYVS